MIGMTRTTMACLLICFAVSACATGGDKHREMMPAPTAVAPYENLGLIGEQTTASLWNLEPQSLFGNRRARNVGDILTVIVSVDERAQLQNSMSRSRANQENFEVNSLFGVPEWANGVLPGGATVNPAVDVSRNAEASGDGSITRQERITLRLAAQVVEKLPNGHLVILGSQRIRVNQETRDLRLKGIVRPDDITRENTITHEKVAAADIVYTGQGQTNQSLNPRLGSRVLDIIVPF